jgi:hypothetical protein
VSNKAKNLYYLFPNHPQAKRKRLVNHLMVGTVVGLIAAGLLAAMIYTMES